MGEDIEIKKKLLKKVELLKALLCSYNLLKESMLAITFDRIFLETLQEFGISRADLYNKIIA